MQWHLIIYLSFVSICFPLGNPKVLKDGCFRILCVTDTQEVLTQMDGQSREE